MKISHTIMIAMSILLHDNVHAQEYTLSIQPILPKDEVVVTYQPLADYLTNKTGHKITIKTYKNFFTYWQKMKHKKNFDLVLDAAHFTDYRIQNNDYNVIVNFPGTVSYSLVTYKDSLIYKTDDLILKNIATVPSPSLIGIRLYEIFNDPSRLPIEVTVHNTYEAVDAIAEGKVDAAIIPSSMVNKYSFLRVVMTTVSSPNIALSASPAIPSDLRKNILDMLINAHRSIEGVSMLNKIGLTEFASARTEDYAGYSKLLEDKFGYTPSINLDMAVNK